MKELTALPEEMHMEVQQPVAQKPAEGVSIPPDQAKREMREYIEETIRKLRKKWEEEEVPKETESKKDEEVPQEEKKEIAPFKEHNEGEEKKVLLEEGFATIEAQEAYYEFIEAIQEFDVITGKGGLRARIAMDVLQEHYHEIALDKLLYLLLIMMGKMFERLGSSEKPEFTIEEREEEKILTEYDEEITEVEKPHFIERPQLAA